MASGGSVTTIDNISGSKWGADATLVEELSIGQLEGADEYAFGMISGIWPTEDRVYVSDMLNSRISMFQYLGSN